MAPQLTTLLSALLLSIYGSRSVYCECDNATELSIQVDTLLAEYDRDTPPAAPVNVEFSIYIKYATIIEPQSVIRAQADLKLRWQDPRVRWNASEWGCDNTLTMAERLWLPDLVVVSGGATDSGAAGQRARLSATGEVTWVSRVDVTAPIDLDLYYWPKDTHIGYFKFGSRTMTDLELKLIIKQPEATVVAKGGEWLIEGVHGFAATWMRGGEEVSAASCAVRVSRRAPAHALSATAAHLAATALLAAAALQPPTQRYPLAACASLISALWLVSVLGVVSGSWHAPLLVSLQCALCACGAMCACAAALVAHVAALSAPAPRPLRALLSALSSRCTLTPSTESCGWSGAGAWSAAALLLDRAVRVALIVTLLVLLLLLIV